MTDAYKNAESGHYSKELDTLAKIDRFGVKAILGRDVLYFGEMQKMIAAENVYVAYHSRRVSKQWAEWADKNQKLYKILTEVENTLQDE